VTDRENVVAFFPDTGLFCYSTEGAEKWRADPGPFHSMHGITGSPVLVDNLVVLQVDQLRGSELAAYDLVTGELVWEVPRIDGLTGGYSTPSILTGNFAPSLIVTSGPEELACYLASNGEKVWSVPGVSNAPITLPVVSNGRVFVCEPTRTSTTPFNLLAALDANKDGKYTLEEAERSIPSRRLLERIDTDHGNGDGVIEESEWNAAFGMYLNKGGLVAVNLPNKGASATAEVCWTYRKSVPYIASPLVLDGVLYAVQDGGIVTTFDPAAGEVFRRGRLSQGGKNFYASPVAADGKVFLVDTEGRFTIIKAGREWEELSTTSLDEPCFATPAICGGRILVRTSKGLYCFGETTR
jgi:outer membrane protein assembly factor BamB